MSNNIIKNQCKGRYTIIYARVSTREQAQHGHSIHKQIESCLDFADKKGLSNLKIIVDEGASGRSLKRKGILDMQILIKKNLVENLVIVSFDRLTRNHTDTLSLLALFKKHDVTLHGVNFNASRSTSDERLIMDIMSLLAQAESERTGERTRNGIAGGLSKGIYAISKAPFGYTKEEGKLIMIPVQITLVKEIFNKYVIKELPVETIASQLVTVDPRLKSSKIRNILRDVRYTGIYVHQGKLYHNLFQRVIPQNIFELAQARLDKNSKARKYDYLFYNKVYCECCGQVLSCKSAKKKVTAYLYYACSNDVCEHFKVAVGQQLLLRKLGPLILNRHNQLSTYTRFTKKSYLASLIDHPVDQLIDIDKDILTELILTELPNFIINLKSKLITSKPQDI